MAELQCSVKMNIVRQYCCGNRIMYLVPLLWYAAFCTHPTQLLINCYLDTGSISTPLVTHVQVPKVVGGG